jgi:endonuclease YncB( thermonuclease family)
MQKNNQQPKPVKKNWELKIFVFCIFFAFPFTGYSHSGPVGQDGCHLKNSISHCHDQTIIKNENKSPRHNKKNKKIKSLTILPGSIYGKVVGVVDGDTIWILTSEKRRLEIRLLGIDAPEKRQAFGNKAKQALSDKIHGKDVEVRWKKRGRYGRILGKVFYNKADINLEMIKLGLAWHYKKYEDDQFSGDAKSYGTAESLSRKNKIGLWSAKNSPPWVFTFEATKDGYREGQSGGKQIAGPHCCKEMVAKIKLDCKKHLDVFSCPDVLVRFNDKLKEYGIIVHDGGNSSVLISFCPWCGKKLSGAKSLKSEKNAVKN